MSAALLSSLKTPLILVVLRIGGAAAAFALNIVLARSMPASEMGTALTYMSVALLAAIVVSASTEAGCVRFVAAYKESGELPKAKGILTFTKRVVLYLGPVLLLAWLVFLWVWSNQTDQTFSIALALIGAIAVLMGWLRVGAAHAMAFGKVVRSLAPASFFRQLFLLLGVLAWVSFAENLSATTVLWIMLGSIASSVLAQHLLNRGLYKTLDTAETDTSETRTWVKVGLQLGLTLLFVQHSRDLTLAVAAISLPPADIAVLGITTAIIGFAKFGVVAVNQSITPKLAKFVAQNDTAALSRIVFLSNHMKFWPMVICFLGLAVMGPWILGLFGSKFQDATPVLLILMIEPLALAFFGPGGNYLSFSGRQHVLLPLAALAILVLCVTITIGARVAGLEGAAWGASITWLFWTISLALSTRKTSGLDVTMLSSLRQLVSRKG